MRVPQNTDIYVREKILFCDHAFGTLSELDIDVTSESETSMESWRGLVTLFLDCLDGWSVYRILLSDKTCSSTAQSLKLLVSFTRDVIGTCKSSFMIGDLYPKIIC